MEGGKGLKLLAARINATSATVAPPVVEAGNTQTPKPVLPAGLGAGGDGEFLAAVERVDLDEGSQRGLGDAHGHLKVQGRAVAHQGGVIGHLEVDVEVAGRATSGADGAPPGEAQRGSVVNPGGDLDGEGGLLDNTAIAVTLDARAGDQLAGALTGWARRGGHHLTED